MLNKKLRDIVYYFIGTIIVVGFTSCDSTGGESINEEASTITAKFIDSAVSNLHVRRASGEIVKTDENGEFECMIDEVVNFGFGTDGFISLGEGKCQTIMTPVDIVKDAKDATNEDVISIAQILQTLDDDQNLDNGINILQSIHDEMDIRKKEASRKRMWWVSSYDYLTLVPEDVELWLSYLTYWKPQIRYLAQYHLTQSLIALYDGTYSGVYTSNTNSSECPKDEDIVNVVLSFGDITGTAQLYGTDINLEGSYSYRNGTEVQVNGTGEYNVVYTGIIDVGKNFSGSWVVSEYNCSGAFALEKQ